MNGVRLVLRVSVAIFVSSCGGRTGLAPSVTPASPRPDAADTRADSGAPDKGSDANPDTSADREHRDARPGAEADVPPDAERVSYPLTVNNQWANGTVTSIPAGIDCGATCVASFPAYSVITLTAKPNATSFLAAWAGDCAGVGPRDCVVTMDGPKSVTAQFNPIIYSLTVVTAGAPGMAGCCGLVCGSNSTCSVPAGAGSVITLTATPGPTSYFEGWSGACTGLGDCVVTMSTNQSVTAHFGYLSPDGRPEAGNDGSVE